MIDVQIFNEACQCPRCQRMQKQMQTWPDLPPYNPHKYDYLHAEDESIWKFDKWCRCELCASERKRLRERVF